MNAVATEMPVKPFRRQKKDNLSPLQTRLKMLGIVPLDRASVQAYMDHKIHQLKNPGIFGISWYAPLFCFIFAGVLATAGFRAKHLRTDDACALVCIVIAFASFGVITVRQRLRGKQDACWEKMDFERYISHHYGIAYSVAPKVPEPAMERAKLILQEIPGAEVKVYYVYLDPFLSVEFKPFGAEKAEEEFFDFFDEKGFLP